MVPEFLEDGGGRAVPCRRIMPIGHCNEEREFRERSGELLWSEMEVEVDVSTRVGVGFMQENTWEGW